MKNGWAQRNFKLVRNPGIKHVSSREKIQRLPKSISNLNVSLSHLLESWKEKHFEAQHVDPFLCHETKKLFKKTKTEC